LAAHDMPTVCIVPMDTAERTTTPQGRPIVVCPAQTIDDKTCADCGLCARADRKIIIGFRAHGTRAKIADQKARRVIPIAKI
jgi:polyferredoxin